MDRLCAAVFRPVSRKIGLGTLFLTAVTVLLLPTAVAVAEEPVLGAAILMSVVPAVLLTVYFWESDPYDRSTLKTLTVTFLLGCMVTSVAVLANTFGRDALYGFPTYGVYFFFFLVVAPVEEGLKMLAVRLHGYVRLQNPVGGAVLGAVAGLGFATIENFVYLSDAVPLGTVTLAEGSVMRSGASIGHVFWSSIAGYYVGLAKLSPENRGPILLKGLLIAVVLHATYNSVSVTLFSGGADVGFGGTVEVPFGGSEGYLYAGFIIVFYGAMGYYLIRKIERHRTIKRGVPGLFE